MSVLKNISVLLADDDEDDCILFKEAIQQVPIVTKLLIVRDGKKLMESLNKKTQELPDVVFMDLSMPIKDGFECMSEIRYSAALRHLPVVILSTHSNQEIITQIYKAGANHYVRKPGKFSDLKGLIYNAIKLVLASKENIFVNEKITLTKQKNL